MPFSKCFFQDLKELYRSQFQLFRYIQLYNHHYIDMQKVHFHLFLLNEDVFLCSQMFINQSSTGNNAATTLTELRVVNLDNPKGD